MRWKFIASQNRYGKCCIEHWKLQFKINFFSFRAQCICKMHNAKSAMHNKICVQMRSNIEIYRTILTFCSHFSLVEIDIWDFELAQHFQQNVTLCYSLQLNDYYDDDNNWSNQTSYDLVNWIELIVTWFDFFINILFQLKLHEIKALSQSSKYFMNWNWALSTSPRFH